MWLEILLALASLAFYFVAWKPKNYWKSFGIAHDVPVPFFGNMLPIMLRQLNLCEILENIYKGHPNARYFGTHQFLTPVVVFRDEELIKKVTVKDFDNFTDHQNFAVEGVDPLWDGNLLANKGDKWRDMRSTLSPCFTGSKMKIMYELMSESVDNFIKFFVEKQEDVVVVEMKDSFTRLSNDVIANCAFGISCNSLKDPENEFYKESLSFTDIGVVRGMKFLAYTISPTISKMLKLSVIEDNHRKFFTKTIMDSVRYRQQHGVVRPDMIHILMEARKNQEQEGDGKKKRHEITDADMVAQSLVFLFGGFETTSMLMTFMAYELALHPEVQEKLREEVCAAFDEDGGSMSYDALHRLKYLDMVVLETLRKWPPAVQVDRICTKDYTIPAERPDEIDFTIKKGTAVWIPTYAIHRDPKHFPDPETFDPERFCDEGKPFLFHPFGLGPRICIASRFALMENKLLISHLLRHFEIVTVDKTASPLVLKKGDFSFNVEGGVWLGLKKRRRHS